MDHKERIQELIAKMILDQRSSGDHAPIRLIHVEESVYQIDIGYMGKVYTIEIKG